MLDRDADMITAVLTSVRAVAANPVAMVLWATIILLLTALATGALFLGLIIVIPVLGHGTWYAYFDLVDFSTLPSRRPQPHRPTPMFHISEEQFSEFGVTFGIAAFILHMMFIIWDLANESKAGELGTLGE